ncbi:MAG: acetate/propionate family kinase [Sphingomonadales bacterium]|nr:acetate/propionate family kinase [Sphingomonadales bacterium]
MSETILTLNIGSSTIKFALYDHTGRQQKLRGEIDHIDTTPVFSVNGGVVAHPPSGATADLVAWILDWIAKNHPGDNLVAVGHRVVHGGRRYQAPTILDDEVMAYLSSLVSLAPLHQPHNLAGIRAVTAHRPELLQVACFDTAFHRTQPRVAELYALPRALSEEGVIRYGFHGLSYDYIAGILPEHAGARADGRVIVAHLGAGSSLCAMKNRQSVATTMGFTALEGLPMASRTGALDPGVLLYLLSEKGYDATALEMLLYRQSGLLGLSGISGDMRTLLASQDPRAKEAIAVYCYQISRWIGSLAAAVGGLDVLVFTAGIGERAAAIRAKVCEAARWLGVKIDPVLNVQNEINISVADSQVAVLVLPTDEESVIARAAVSQMS